ncbi:MAG TPA: serine/threonine-protein kinase [Burkholderiales bacterium]|nr:serine/threonine-protein kinase [Burkholderiales bacterium]
MIGFFRDATRDARKPLAKGLQLGSYRLERMLASGGFSLVYLARDARGGAVAIKEYLPAVLATRKGGSPVPTVAASTAAAYRHGLQCFFEEAKALSSLSHPNVVRVLDFFREHDTAYMVMSHESGGTLKDRILAQKRPPPELWVRQTFLELLDGLREVHARRLLHLDIKPGNIYLRSDGSPLLIDFGAARQVLEADAPSLPPLFTPGFAAPERQKHRDRLGPWSDVYSVGATIYSCLTAQVPPDAGQRLEHDRLAPARKAGAGTYTGELLEIVDWCLRLDPLARPQSVFALQKALLGERAPGSASGSGA